MELDNLKKQFETAKVDVERPFPQEEELKAKTDRLNELNALLMWISVRTRSSAVNPMRVMNRPKRNRRTWNAD